MKSSFGTSLLFFLISTTVSAQGVAPAKVSKQVELVGIVFRLAEVPEYSYETYKDYSDAVHKHFDPYKGHKAVALAKELNRNGAGYSYVASFAVHLTELGELKYSLVRLTRERAGRV